MSNETESQSHILRLLAIMAQLRDPEKGCPWDRAQTYQSIVPHTIEEAYEVADAAERQDFDDLRDELGDLLFQVVFLARIAEEEARFNFTDVAESLVEKLIRRHPHVFGDTPVQDSGEVSQRWESIKEVERSAKREANGGTDQSSAILEGVSRSLPAMTRSVKLQRRAARVGFDWPDADGVFAKVREELAELEAAWRAASTPQVYEELGDLLFSCANLARHLGVDPEGCARQANQKFENRFNSMEKYALADGQDIRQLTDQDWTRLWGLAKDNE